MTEAVTKTIVGPCEEIIDKPDNEWVRFNINVGSQYPIGVSTKKQEIIDAARAVGGSVATWTFQESQGNENPKKPGTYFTNRYLEKVEAGAHPVADVTTGVSPAPQRPQAGEHAPLAVGDRERSIVRQACLKAAAAIYQGKGADKRGESTEDAPVWQDEAVTLVIVAASRMENWVMRDLEDPPF